MYIDYHNVHMVRAFKSDDKTVSPGMREDTVTTTGEKRRDLANDPR